MLTKIAVQGLFNEIDYEIPLMDGHLTFIHAQNGFGKSTLMRLVYNILQGNLEDVRVVPFERLDLVFDDGSNLIVENRNQELTVQMSKNRLEEPVDADDLPSLLGSLYIGPERLYLSDGMGNLKPSIDIYMQELSDSIRRAIADSEIVPKSEDSKKYTDADLDTIFKNAEAKINFIRQAGFQPVIPSGYRFPPSRFEIGDNPEKYKALALTLKAYTDTYYQRAHLYRKIHMYDEAMVDYGYLVQLDPKEVEGYLGIGAIASAQNKRDDAIKAFSMAIKLHPEDADNYAYRATEYFNAYDYENSTKDVVSALEIDRSNKRALWVLNYLKEYALDDVQKIFKKKAKKTKDNYWLDILNNNDD